MLRCDCIDVYGGYYDPWLLTDVSAEIEPKLNKGFNVYAYESTTKAFKEDIWHTLKMPLVDI